MTTYKGNLHKMRSELADPVKYFLELGDRHLIINECLEQHIEIKYSGLIHCIHCGRKTNKSFQQGYCFPCFRKLQECDLCMIHPERCRSQYGPCPDDDWAHAQCNQSHIVYLANSSGLKVGITRECNVPMRWIDQGAVQAIPIYRTSNRFQAGVLEVALKQFVNDKTNWRVMLKAKAQDLDLKSMAKLLSSKAEESIQGVFAQFAEGAISPLDEKVVTVDYPVLAYPVKISSLSLDKQPEITGRLLGIKGQYLILDCGVFNVRKFGGYEVTFVV